MLNSKIEERKKLSDVMISSSEQLSFSINGVDLLVMYGCCCCCLRVSAENERESIKKTFVNRKNYVFKMFL